MEEGETFNPPNLSVELYNLKQQYERLKDSHLKILNVNQNLEDKMLQNINRHETEKVHLLQNVSSLQAQVHELQNLNRRLTTENVIIIILQLTLDTVSNHKTISNV